MTCNNATLQSSVLIPIMNQWLLSIFSPEPRHNNIAESKQERQTDVVTSLQAVVLRFRSLRKRHCRAIILNPRSRPRHENVNIKLFLKKTSSKYIDFQQEPQRSKRIEWSNPVIKCRIATAV